MASASSLDYRLLLDNEEELVSFSKVTGASREKARFFLEAANGNLNLAVEFFYKNKHAEENKLAIGSFFQTKVVIADPDAPDQPTNTGGKNEIKDCLEPPRDITAEIIQNFIEKVKELGAEEIKANHKDDIDEGLSLPMSTLRLCINNECPVKERSRLNLLDQPVTNVIKLWKNCFQIDDGDLCSYTNVKNREFLSHIESGLPPQEILGLDAVEKGTEIILDIQDLHEIYKDSIPEVEFADHTFTNINESHRTSRANSLDQLDPLAPQDQEYDPYARSEYSKDDEKLADHNMNVDETQPTTCIQIRLSDHDQRFVIKANPLRHTIADLREYINTARPEYASKAYSLTSMFTNEELTDDQLNCEQAAIMNGVVIVKIVE
jgi:UBX domain-containing protein 1